MTSLYQRVATALSTRKARVGTIRTLEGPEEGNMSARQDSRPTGAEVTHDQPGQRHELAEIGIRLLDEAHVAWQRAELECEKSLRAWYDGSPRASARRYLSYRAALEREQAAACDLQRLWELSRFGHDALAAASSHADG